MASTSAGLIGGTYSVDFSHPLEGAAQPRPFAASGNGQPGYMAVPVLRGAPARARTLSAMAAAPIRNLLSPLAHGPAPAPAGDTGYFVVCPAPPGPSLQATLRPWSETELIEQLLKPAALVLASLHAKGITHRAIRPDNLFQAARGAPVTLGCAWASPAGSLQPAWVEPPYSATCFPAGRGDGTIADDVYALGAVLLTLALGVNPADGVPDDTLLYRKLDEGSYAALAGGHRLPAGIADLVRGMLADDPDHRPSPALLATPAAARARRIAARPIKRAQRPIEVGAHTASTARTLAHALHREPEAATFLLRNGGVDRWLRRGLGDAVAASQVEEAVRAREVQASSGDSRADPTLIAHAIAILDPAAPLVWRSVALWPDGLGPVLDHVLHHAPSQAASLAEVATAYVAQAWSKLRDTGGDAPVAWMESRDVRTLMTARSGSLVPLRLSYSLNPLAPCNSPLLKRAWVVRLADLLPAMEAALATRLPADQPLMDAQINAFVASRRDERLQADIGYLAADVPPEDTLAQMRLIARLQAKLHPNALPQLCAWASDAAQSLIQTYRSKSRRAQIAVEIARLADVGQLPPIVALLDDQKARLEDAEGCSTAEARLATIEQLLADLDATGSGTADSARRIGQDIAAGLGAIACLTAVAFAVFA